MAIVEGSNSGNPSEATFEEDTFEKHRGEMLKFAESRMLSRLQIAAHENSREKGFWDEQKNYFRENMLESLDPSAVREQIPLKLMLIVTEVAEAMEAFRENQFTSFNDETGKPQGLPTELADIVIRTMDLCGALGIDLEAEVISKMAYNSTRAYKHGKAC